MERTLHTPTPEEVWATQVGKLDIKQLLAEGAHLHHVDDSCTFFPEDPNVPGTGELAVPGAEGIIAPINAVTPYFGDNQIGLYEVHPQTGNAYFAETYRALGLPKDDYSTLTLAEFRTFRQDGVQFPFDADRFEQYLEATGGSITLWPPHARENTPGSEIHPGIVSPPERRFFKGQSPEVHHLGSRDTFLEDAGTIPYLLRKRVQTVFGCGLAEDFCPGTEMLATAEAGIKSLLFLDGTAAIAAPVSETETTQSLMRKRLLEAGVVGITSAQFLEQVQSNS